MSATLFSFFRNLSLIVWIVFIDSSAFSQTDTFIPVDKNGIISYRGLIERNGVDKKILFNKSKSYFYETFKDANLQTIEEADYFSISFRGQYMATRNKAKPKETLSYKITLRCEDGKITYEMNDFIFYGTTAISAGTTVYSNGLASTFIHPGKTYQYKLERFNTLKTRSKKNNIFIQIDEKNRQIINHMIVGITTRTIGVSSE